eukprot:GHVU01116739.1.p1 GENE.GHVU01116739.1~~GHVU01116739.1.p1  ORF type:complete len:383 (-),score=54.32 GHVU01116739.1:632-1780(-)
MNISTMEFDLDCCASACGRVLHPVERNKLLLSLSTLTTRATAVSAGPTKTTFLPDLAAETTAVGGSVKRENDASKKGERESGGATLEFAADAASNAMGADERGTHFWGKLMGTEGRYYIAYRLLSEEEEEAKLKADATARQRPESPGIFRSKQFYYSLDGLRFEPLPRCSDVLSRVFASEITHDYDDDVDGGSEGSDRGETDTIQHLVPASQQQHRLLGNPHRVLRVRKPVVDIPSTQQQPGGDQDDTGDPDTPNAQGGSGEDEADDSQAIGEEQEEGDDGIAGDGASKVGRRGRNVTEVTEADLLAWIVASIDRDTSIVPKGAFELGTGFKMRSSKNFEGARSFLTPSLPACLSIRRCTRLYSSPPACALPCLAYIEIHHS